MRLEDTWIELRREASQSKGRPIAMWAGGLILATLSDRGAPQLVVQISGPESVPPSRVETLGFQVDYQTLLVAEGTSICAILEPKESEDLEMFNAVCEHLLSELGKRQGEQTPHVVESLIGDWLDFWRTLRHEFSPSRFTGMLGELLTFDRWIRKDTFRWEFWRGPTGGPHDYCGDGFDIEVKSSTKRTGPLVHEISSIDQLQERPHRRLKLMSFRFGFSETGAESTHELIQRVLSDPAFNSLEAKAFAEEAISKGGYSANIPPKFERFDLWSERIYEVREGFPRLNRQTVAFDERITELRYSVDLSGCDSFLEPIRELDLGSQG